MSCELNRPNSKEDGVMPLLGTVDSRYCKFFTVGVNNNKNATVPYGFTGPVHMYCTTQITVNKAVSYIK